MMKKAIAISILPFFLFACLHTQGSIKVDPEPESSAPALVEPCYSAILTRIPDATIKDDDHEIEGGDYQTLINEQLDSYENTLMETGLFSEMRIADSLVDTEESARMAPWLVKKEDTIEISIYKDSFSTWGPLEITSVIFYAILATAIVPIFLTPVRKSAGSVITLVAVKSDGEKKEFSATMTHSYWRNGLGRRKYFGSEDEKKTAMRWRESTEEAWESIAEQMMKESAFFRCGD